jgi:hypothetical protein
MGETDVSDLDGCARCTPSLRSARQGRKLE